MGDTDRLKMGLFFCDAFHALSHTLNCAFEPGAVPKRSILRSPFISIGIGWAITEGGPDMEYSSA